MGWGWEKNLVHISIGRKIPEKTKVLFSASLFCFGLNLKLILILLNYRLPVFFQAFFLLRVYFKSDENFSTYFFREQTQTQDLRKRKSLKRRLRDILHFFLFLSPSPLEAKLLKPRNDSRQCYRLSWWNILKTILQSFKFN